MSMTPYRKALIAVHLSDIETLVDLGHMHCIGRASAFDLSEARTAVAESARRLAQLPEAQQNAQAVLDELRRHLEAGATLSRDNADTPVLFAQPDGTAISGLHIAYPVPHHEAAPVDERARTWIHTIKERLPELLRRLMGMTT